MNESPIRKFCESPYRRLIVAIGTSIVALVVLLPLADVYFDDSENLSILADELKLAHQTAEKLPQFEKQVAKLQSDLEELELLAVSDESVSRYRSKLVEMIRKSGCQIRRLDLGAPTLRPWMVNDDPLTDSKRNLAQQPTPFSLERRTVALVVDGSIESVRAFLKEMQGDETFAYPKKLQVQSSDERGSRVTLDLEMWLFAISRKSA